jgi:hypothetical protein
MTEVAVILRYKPFSSGRYPTRLRTDIAEGDPSTDSSPESGESMPKIIRKLVVFPAPLGPKKP